MKTPIPLTAVAVLAALSLASCSGTPPEATAAPSVTKTPETPKATVTPAPAQPAAPSAPSAEPTCDTIISPGTVDALTSQGWTFEQEEFRIGETVVADGLLCLWADFTTASDHGQMYAWGALDEVASRTAQSGLQRDGWLRSTEGESTFYTEDPAYAIATDDEGYGMTYEFGDGWVKFADTKQGLLLIEWEQ